MIIAIQTLAICATLLSMAFMILLALPNSKLRSIFLECLKYFMAGILILLVISPIDFLPDIVPIAGWGDDLGYALGAAAAVMSARKNRQERKLLVDNRKEGAK